MNERRCEECHWFEWRDGHGVCLASFDIPIPADPNEPGCDQWRKNEPASR